MKRKRRVVFFFLGLLLCSFFFMTKTYGSILEMKKETDNQGSSCKRKKEGYGTKSKTTKQGDFIVTNRGKYKIEVRKENKEPALPKWQKRWEDYPRVKFPKRKPQRILGEFRQHSYDLHPIRNDYELERMIRTIYFYAKENPQLWEADDPTSNQPNFTIKIAYEDDMLYHAFFSWRESEIEKLVVSVIGGKEFRIFSVDVYNNGKFNETQYYMK